MKNYEIIVIGGGVAGLYTALNFPQKTPVLLLSKSALPFCNSNLAQGGIAGVWNSPEDSVEIHKQDTLNAGGFVNNENTVDVLVNEAKIDLEKLVDFDVEFNKISGDYHRTLEGGHSKRRIFHHNDVTGEEIMSKLSIAVKHFKNIIVKADEKGSYGVVDIKKTSTGFSVLTDGGESYNCHYLVFATGGIGECFINSTNYGFGDGIAFAAELGANIKNISKIQFHPTAFVGKDKTTNRNFLISEAVRGEGAFLLNSKGQRFMDKYDSRLELAPRDVVSKAMLREGGDVFYIDISRKPKAEILEHFPNICKKLEEFGLDMSTDKIPVYPCQHYLMGGIDVDINAETSVPKLYAVGECSHTGLHGNNRLASNSLMEACVFGRRCAEHITENLQEFSYEDYDFHTETVNSIRENHYNYSLEDINKILQETFFVVPNYELLPENLEKIRKIKDDLCNNTYLKDNYYTSLKSASTIVCLILEEVLKEKERK